MVGCGDILCRHLSLLAVVSLDPRAHLRLMLLPLYKAAVGIGNPIDLSKKVVDGKIRGNTIEKLERRKGDEPTMVSGGVNICRGGGGPFSSDHPTTPPRARRKAKAIGARKTNLILMVGDGINSEKIQGLTDCALVGRMEHARVSYKMLKSWVFINWKPLLNYTPRFSFLVNGWIIFHLLSISDREILEEGLWIIVRGSLIFTRWHVGFNPLVERIRKRYLWVVLRGFPVHLWTQSILVEVGNLFGRFMEDSMLFGVDKRCAKILVEFDTIDGLPKSLEIKWRDSSFVQLIDYLFIPFRCHNFHETSHLVKQCIVTRQHTFVRKSQGPTQSHLSVGAGPSYLVGTVGKEIRVSDCSTTLACTHDSLSGKSLASFSPKYDELSIEVISFIEELERNMVSKHFLSENPVVDALSVDEVGSPTFILEISDSTTSDSLVDTLSEPVSSVEPCVVLPRVPLTVSPERVADISVITIDDLSVSVDDYTGPPIIESSESLPETTGVSIESSPLLGSYRDILLAHLPIYIDKVSSKPGVVPIGATQC